MDGIRMSPYGTVEKPEPTTSLEDMMKEMLSGQRALQNRFKEMNTRLERRIDGLDGKVTALDRSLASLDARVKKLENKPSGPSAAGSSGASTSGSDSFEPKYLTIRGWVEYEDWASDKSLGWTREQAKDLADKLNEAAGELSQHMGDVQMRGNTSYELKCNPQPTPWRQGMFSNMGRILNFVRGRVDKDRILGTWEPAWSVEVTDSEL
mmetsp:Transcript_113793/g.321810  ORF Transcript_113793/g.321810 Transcript_113793/m.321810 type:complete len:208 (+) Transcript_113793:457-1080(+)|eukprot:CAMPEP_0117481074 /NCGR_PEP_ID=MMETSP0784-20121206/12716_1 /TAXON_ID=39447 /ORGANISM="" /LENGTH=207 /DNA_ID=CAMNT_0005275527 /DNA_START=353 /DNA_END=976 /DNA_ORIENTATION=-